LVFLLQGQLGLEFSVCRLSTNRKNFSLYFQPVDFFASSTFGVDLIFKIIKSTPNVEEAFFASFSLPGQVDFCP